jgi:signal transduction histidine kinase/CheY-like chemotaxis protein/HAMP domain-containing protein
VKIYPRILLNTLPLVLAGFLFVGTLSYYLSRNAMTNLAEKWLSAKLADARRMASEDLAVLRKFGLEKIEANVIKAQHHTAESIRTIALGGGGYIWVVNDKGIVKVYPDARQMPVRVAREQWFQEMRGHSHGKSLLYGQKQKLLTVYTYFAPWHWYILASVPQSELYGEAGKMRAYVLAIAFAALLITAMALMFLARRLTAPLNTLALEAQGISQGDYPVAAKFDRNDEIGTLSVAFSSMTRQLSRRITMERIISDISRRFIYVSPPNVDAAMPDALRRIGEYAGADRSYVGKFSIQDRRVGRTHEWCRQGVQPQIDGMMGLCLDDLAWFMRRMEDPGYVLASDLEMLPEEAAAEKRLWQQRGVQSIARVPMVYGGELRGFVGLDALTNQKDWSQEEIVFLQRVAEIFCHTLERQWFQETLAAEKERLEVALQSKRRMQEELLKVEKLESIGVLAGGLAHDFNNILTAVIGNVALAKNEVRPDTPVFAKMGEIERAAFRARNLTQQLLTFSKGGAPVKKTLLLSQIFYESIMFALGGTNVGLEYTPPSELWPVEADEGQISQVINNLVINAVQAMPGGGVIYGNLKNVVLPVASSLPLPPGRYVKMTLKDFGNGISKKDLGRIFDPFFTTKKAGSGLGLATVYSILEKHNGYITVDSQPGCWTLFCIYLPASSHEIYQRPEIEKNIVHGSGNILIMDDEEIVLEVLGAILSNAGYSVTAARDGRQMLDAYQKARSNGTPFDAVVLDLTIPGGMGGKEAVKRLLHLDPRAKAIVSSGYSNDPVMADFETYGFRGAVSKPFKAEDLCTMVKDVLDAADVLP